MFLKVFRTKGQRLELRYRPDDLYCKPTCANKYTTASLLLKVCKVKKKGQVETPDGDMEYEYQGEIIGIISGIYKFTSKCMAHLLLCALYCFVDEYEHVIFWYCFCILKR